MATTPGTRAVIDAANVFTSPRRFPGGFLLTLSAVGGNVCRLQWAPGPEGPWTSATDESGDAYAFAAPGPHVVDNVAADLWWRAGSPEGDYVAGEYEVRLDGG